MIKLDLAKEKILVKKHIELFHFTNNNRHDKLKVIKEINKNGDLSLNRFIILGKSQGICTHRIKDTQCHYYFNSIIPPYRF